VKRGVFEVSLSAVLVKASLVLSFNVVITASM
jgi:hypothetical protein